MAETLESPPSQSTGKRLLQLFALFVTWKTFLLLLAFTAPGIGYDTSTSLLIERRPSRGLQDLASSLSPAFLKLVRWDSIYFMHMSTVGHLFEQEWAFGIGLSTTVSQLTRILQPYLPNDRLFSSALMATAVSHFAHWQTVLMTFWLVRTILRDYPERRLPIAFITAALHIISPAGIFLSAPYTESLYASLNTLGVFFYVAALAYIRDGAQRRANLSLLMSGLLSGVATIVRSNGLLSGIPFLYDAFRTAFVILKTGPTLKMVNRLTALVLGGLLIAVGFAIPQFIAYREYCYPQPGVMERPWCSALVPSIYSWVQSHYWNNGLFRYWTVSNLPLFALATPTLCILIYSSFQALSDPGHRGGSLQGAKAPTSGSFERECLTRLALPQAVLAATAITSSHIQIITRLSSGYLLWYLWLATRLVAASEPRSEGKSNLLNKAIVRWMVVYAIIQAGLFSTFLPPA